jgi:6-phosphogluconolactonase
MSAEPEVLVVADPGEAASAAAERIASILADAVAQRDRADWATTGSSSIVGIYRRLVAVPLRDAVPWPAVQVWWGDDRFVPRDHPLSNVKPLDDILLGIGLTEEGVAGGRGPGVPLPVGNLHPFRTAEAIGGGHGPSWCAATLADELAGAHLPTDGPWPILDLLLLGVGADGHVLSVFPGSAALGASELALAIQAPSHIEPHVERVTLNPALIGAARRIVVVATGSAKAAVLAGVFGEARDPSRWPAQLARRAEATWILDAAAAASLPR